MTRRMCGLVRSQFFGLLAFALVLGSIGYAASGGTFVLGRANTADRATRLRNTGTGPALQLRVAQGQPPLKVNSSRIVPNLNAGLLGGKRAKAYAKAGASYTRAQSDIRYLAAGSAYTKSEADDRFANADDVYTKVESDSRELVLFALPVEPTEDGTLLSREFDIPGPGIVAVTIIGQCENVSATDQIRLHAAISKPGGGLGTSGNDIGVGTTPANVGCTFGLRRVVTSADTFRFGASWTHLDGGPANLRYALVLVTYQPPAF